MTLTRSPPKIMVGTRLSPGEQTTPEMESSKQELERVSVEAAQARSENEALRKQVERLIQINDALQAERTERQQFINTSTSNTAGEDTQQTQASTSGNNNLKTIEVPQLQPSTSKNRQANNPSIDLVQGILDHFQSLQIHVPIPTFDGLGNPAEFIEKIEKYFVRKSVNVEQKLLFIEDALKGRARAWVDAHSTPFMNFLHFKSIFLNEFYSVKVRVESKNIWSTRKFKSSDGTLLEYFADQRRIAKYFNPPMDTYEINYHIIKQLPSRAREVLSVIDYIDTDRISQALGRLDASNKEVSENKATYNAPKYNAPAYRGSAPQTYARPKINRIREAPRSDAFRNTREFYGRNEPW